MYVVNNSARALLVALIPLAMVHALLTAMTLLAAQADQPNDLPLLTWAATSYAVANAHPDVLASQRVNAELCARFTKFIRVHEPPEVPISVGGESLEAIFTALRVVLFPPPGPSPSR